MSDIQTDRPALSAVISMNYFFLKVIAGTLDDEYVKQELEGFIVSMNDQLETLDNDMHAAIAQEVHEGQYFEKKSAEQIKAMIDETIEELTGDFYPNVTQYYVRIARKKLTF